MINIPDHLKPHIAIQDYSKYTDIDHAGWRFIMRVSKDFFKKHAHKKYIDGLIQTGITVDSIPRISEMDERLKKFGWRAVTVTGFIPPAVFLEFQSLGILPIACDMRRLEHIEYTPSPDIVHEAAGHAPIIADKGYATYLKKFGEIARKVIFAKEDIEVYEAIKYLSDIKEAAGTTQEEINAAYDRLRRAYKKVKYVSEATELSRLGWWTIEYGLVKTGREFKIYGAGLLSSVSESYDAIKGKVKKIPLTIKCVEMDYDITKPQPQLFYVKNFSELKRVIEKLADRMAYKIGGTKGLARAQKAGTVTTAVFDSGVQISGILKNTLLKNSKTIYLQYEGATQLAFEDIELPGHSPKYHNLGFGTPLGRLKKLGKSADRLSRPDLKKLMSKNSGKTRLEFLSGIVVEGRLENILKRKNKNLILSFHNCKVTLGRKVLFDPSWGTFDMACGATVTSVFGGAADRAAYMRATDVRQEEPKIQVSNLTAEHAELLPLYQKVRELRALKDKGDDMIYQVREILEKLDSNFRNDWLLRLELLELINLVPEPIRKNQNSVVEVIRSRIGDHLKVLGRKSRPIGKLIERGLSL